MKRIVHLSRNAQPYDLCFLLLLKRLSNNNLILLNHSLPNRYITIQHIKPTPIIASVIIHHRLSDSDLSSPISLMAARTVEDINASKNKIVKITVSSLFLIWSPFICLIENTNNQYIVL